MVPRAWLYPHRRIGVPVNPGGAGAHQALPDAFGARLVPLAVGYKKKNPDPSKTSAAPLQAGVVRLDQLHGRSDAGEGRTFLGFITATLDGKFITVSLMTDHRLAWKLELTQTWPLICSSGGPMPVLMQSPCGGSAARLAAGSFCSSQSLPARHRRCTTSALGEGFSCLFLHPLITVGASRLLISGLVGEGKWSI